MERYSQIDVFGEKKKARHGQSVLDVLGKDFLLEHKVVAALMNRHLVSLNTPLFEDPLVHLVTADENVARPVLRQATAHMFHHVMATEFPELRLQVGQSLLGGYFYQVEALDGTQVELEKVAGVATEAMRRVKDSDLVFDMATFSLRAAMDRLNRSSSSKQGLLSAWTHPLVPLVSLGSTVDIQHGPYPPSTGFVPRSEVRAFPPGLVLQFATEQETTYGTGRRLMQSYLEAREWNRTIGVASVGELNSVALQESTARIILTSEALQEKKIAQLADKISDRSPCCRLVCLSGPSSSGKSTVARRLVTQLEVNGLNPVLVSLDDYYQDRRNIPKNEQGEQDFEAPEALDLPLFHQHLQALVAGEPVHLPRFDFNLGGRKLDDEPTRVESEKGVLVLEGLHALNPLIWQPVLEQGSVFRIFVSALTQLVFDEHNRIQTSKVRLLRRIVRDRRFRSTPTGDTLRRWESVRAGEEAYIFPFQEECDAMFNSSLPYEAAVLKVFAYRYLLEVPKHHECQGEAYQLLKFLELFVPIFPDRIPANSVLREFIGGGGFHY